MPRILRKPAVCELTGLSLSSLYRLERAGQFPRRVRLSERLVGYIEGEVSAWIAERQRKAGPAPAEARP